jgi:hypothetical protein
VRCVPRWRSEDATNRGLIPHHVLCCMCVRACVRAWCGVQGAGDLAGAVRAEVEREREALRVQMAAEKGHLEVRAWAWRYFGGFEASVPSIIIREQGGRNLRGLGFRV